ncbi:MAG: 4Fe-4S double cluster binding domain-containing protein [Candidatus Omnitrophota bacterium]
MVRENYNFLLEKLAKDLGVDLVGVAEINAVKEEFFLSRDILKEINYGISLGVRLSPLILAEIETHPTKLYFHHYRVVNHFLDEIALRVSQFIQGKGYTALPIPASQIIDWEKQSAHLSHKKIAILAGLGWWGRNNLVVNPQLGSQFRLVTILTNLPLKPGIPLNEDCGDCRECLSVCPVGAIKENPEEFDHRACFEKLKEFRKSGYTEQFICGICVKACKGKRVK